VWTEIQTRHHKNTTLATTISELDGEEETGEWRELRNEEHLPIHLEY
jgi:hypothetical protein